MRHVSSLALLLVGCTVSEHVVDPVGGTLESGQPAVTGPGGQNDSSRSSRATAPFELDLQSEVPVDAAGIAIASTGGIAHAGLGPVSCDIFTEYGSLGNDYYDAGDDTVVDVGVVGGGEAWMVITPGFINLHPVNTGVTSDSYSVAGVTNARFTDAGFVAISRSTGGCLAGWFGLDGSLQGTTHFEAGACDGSLAVDSVKGVAWLGSADGVIELTRGGFQVIDSTPEAALAFDGSALFVGGSGGQLTSLDADGVQRWKVDLGAPIDALGADPANGAVFVAVDSFQRRVDMLDADDASELGSFSYSSSARQIAVSSSGSRLALNTSTGVEFHDIVDNRSSD